MKYSALLFSIILLSSCSTVTHTGSPARAYASTVVTQQSADTFHVRGDWDYVDYSTVREPRIMVVGGFEANVTRGRCLYSYYVYEQTFKSKASATGGYMDVASRNIRHLDFTREQLDQAASKDGITVRLSEKHNQQFFSAAYLRGFLQKVDEVLRSSPAKPAAPGAPSRLKKGPNPYSIALRTGTHDRSPHGTAGEG